MNLMNCSGHAGETPPQARGRRQLPKWRQIGERNTPAGAGKTMQSLITANEIRKHPRRRGEDFFMPLNITIVIETPPQARGRLPITRKRAEQVRNTPAGAGKTGCRNRKARMMKKHPRRRGEDAPWRRAAASRSETPPQARGRLGGLEQGLGGLGNTPAGAGKTRIPPT